MVIMNGGWLLELETLVGWGMVNGLDDALSSALDISVDQLFLVNIENVLLVRRDDSWDLFRLKGKDSEA